MARLNLIAAWTLTLLAIIAYLLIVIIMRLTPTPQPPRREPHAVRPVIVEPPHSWYEPRGRGKRA